MNEYLKALKAGSEIVVISRNMNDPSHIYWVKDDDLFCFSKSFGTQRITVRTPEQLAEMIGEAEAKNTHIIHCRG